MYHVASLKPLLPGYHVKSFSVYNRIYLISTNYVLYLSSKSNENDDLWKSMENARRCESQGLSPGAGLLTADEQSDAAYADLINTSMDQRGIEELSKEELESLQRGGKMWEKGCKEEPPVKKFGLLGDAAELFKALSGGAHIVKDQFGRT